MIKAYDSGPDTIDRYTIMTEDGECIGMSENANSPQGFNMYIGNFHTDRSGLGEEIELRELPKEVLVAIIDRLEEYYNSN